MDKIKTWDDISTHLIYCKLTGDIPNSEYLYIYNFLIENIPYIINDKAVFYNDTEIYYFHLGEVFYIPLQIYVLFQSNFKYAESIIQGYLKATFDISPTIQITSTINFHGSKKHIIK
jgi:hypothetical protein